MDLRPSNEEVRWSLQLVSASRLATNILMLQTACVILTHPVSLHVQGASVVARTTKENSSYFNTNTSQHHTNYGNLADRVDNNVDPTRKSSHMLPGQWLPGARSTEQSGHGAPEASGDVWNHPDNSSIAPAAAAAAKGRSSPAGLMGEEAPPLTGLIHTDSDGGNSTAIAGSTHVLNTDNTPLSGIVRTPNMQNAVQNGSSSGGGGGGSNSNSSNNNNNNISSHIASHRTTTSSPSHQEGSSNGLKDSLNASSSSLDDPASASSSYGPAGRRLGLGGHTYVICMLSGLVCLAILFTLCGLFHKAEAHQKDGDCGMPMGGGGVLGGDGYLISSFFDDANDADL